nr:hypothetical protein [uncultured Desulfobacter sp.]
MPLAAFNLMTTEKKTQFFKMDRENKCFFGFQILIKHVAVKPGFKVTEKIV